MINKRDTKPLEVLEGDLSVSGNFHLGDTAHVKHVRSVDGTIDVEDDLHIQKGRKVVGDLEVTGRIKAKSVKQPNCGLFPTAEHLKKAYPDPSVGMWASVGDTLPAPIWRCTVDGTWEATGEQGGCEPVDLTDYAHKAEVQAVDDKLTQKEVRDVARFEEIEETVFPLTLKFTADTDIISAGVRGNSVEFTYHAFYKGTDVTSQCTYTFTRQDGSTTEILPPVSQPTIHEDDVDSDTPTDLVFKLQATITDGTTNVEVISDTEEIHIPVVRKSYFGVVEADAVVDVRSLPSFLNVSKVFTTPEVALNNQSVVYSYPASMGELTHAYDLNGFDVVESFSHQTYAHPQYHGAPVPYHVYLYIGSVSIDKLILKFE